MRLLIVGDGAERERLGRLAEELGLSGRILWAGAMADPRPAYAAMDVLVLPSVYEAFGNVLVEAMAHGVPVIERRGDGCQVLTAAEEVIDSGRTGLIADPVEVGDLSSKLRWLAEHPVDRRRMGEAARASALARPWSRVVDEYGVVLDGVAHHRVGPALGDGARRAA